MSKKDELGRKAVCVGWGLLGEWWCAPVDSTEGEIAALIAKVRDGMGEDFISCPDEYIADRLFGGFECAEDTGRRHIYFESGGYSFIAAQEGRFWKNDVADRLRIWRKLIKENQDQMLSGNGPFTSDWPQGDLGKDDDGEWE